MAIIRNVAIYHAKLDPKYPNATFNKNNPTWELQIRTADPAQKAEWDAAGLKPKLMVYKEDTKDKDGEDIGGLPILNENGKKQWRVNLKKKSINKEGNKADPVEVKSHDLKPVDPRSIGNGSIGHIRLFQYDYKNEKPGEATKTGKASVLMEIQLKKHIVYVPKPKEEFGAEEGETIVPEEEGEEAAETSSNKSASQASSSSGSPGKPVDQKPEEAF